jgi:ABC-type phosphate/phosphonate transport system substrate-binding protein
MDPALKKSIIETLLAMHETQGGKVVLKKLGIDRFVIPDDSLYDGVRKASITWESYR